MKVHQAGSHLSEERGGEVGDWSWRRTRRRIGLLVRLALPYRARTAGAPVPSTTVPPRITRSIDRPPY